MTFQEVLKEYKRLIEECVCYKEDHNNPLGNHGNIVRRYEQQIKDFELILNEMFEHHINEVDVNNPVIKPKRGRPVSNKQFKFEEWL